MSNPDDNNQAESRSRKYTLLVVLALVIVGPVIALVFLAVGQISGVEFSPDDFSRRRFTYNQLPLTNWVVFQKTYEDITPNLENYLVSTKLIPPANNKEQVWHLVSESGVQIPSAECDARFLIGYLEKLDEDRNNFWDTWTTEFPRSAKVFWPYVAQLARDEMYLKVADVMRTAMLVTKDNPDELENELQQSMAVVYLQLGSLDFELGKVERALYRLNQSIEYRPSREAYSMRAKVNKEHGFDSKSQSDLNDAKTTDSIDPAGNQ